MREAVGGAWLLSITVAIISVFTAYLAFSVNYAKAFKVKDGIVERIEKYEGFNKDDSNQMSEIQGFLDKIGYANKGKCTYQIDVGTRSNTKVIGVDGSTKRLINSTSNNDKYTYCVEKVTKTAQAGDYASAYYKVTVFYGLSLGMIDFNNRFFLTGETKNIYYPQDGDSWR